MNLTEIDRETILAYADSGMNGQEASRKIYLSRTAFFYRLKRIEQKTGLDPRRFYDLVKLVEMASSDTWESPRRVLVELQENIMSEWISVEDRLPEEAYGCLVVVDDTEPMTGRDFLNILPYFVGWDGDRWNDYEGEQCPFEVRYWMPLPEVPEEEL